jgi:hypothetical protein
MPHANDSSAASILCRPLTDPLTLKAIEHLGAKMRENGYESTSAGSITESEFARFASSQPVDADFALEMLGGLDSLRACLTSGFVRADYEGNLRLAVSLVATAGAVGVIPESHAAGERVYVGPDTWILLDRAWRFGLGGRRAVELGTGSGVVATFLTSRYDHVVATDVTASSVTAASLSRRLLDEPRRSRLSILQADVGQGLRPHSFDFVIVNSPWIPTSVAAEQVFADGGPTGFELPLRFLTEGIDLLTNDGVLVLLCADLRFADGRAPLIDALRQIRTMGFSTEIEETPNTQELSFIGRDEISSLKDLISGRHVSVVVYRKSAD